MNAFSLQSKLKIQWAGLLTPIVRRPLWLPNIYYIPKCNECRCRVITDNSLVTESFLIPYRLPCCRHCYPYFIDIFNARSAEITSGPALSRRRSLFCCIIASCRLLDWPNLTFWNAAEPVLTRCSAFVCSWTNNLSLASLKVIVEVFLSKLFI